jgi:proliferating cell nuclear antigen
VKVRYLFRATYPSGSKFKSIASAIVKITDEAPFYIKPEALEVKVFSPDKTAMVIVKIPSVAFEEYNFEVEDYFVVSSSDLNRVLRRGTRTDILVLELDKSVGVLKTVFRNKKTGVERTFFVELKQSIPEEVPDLDIELGVTVTMLASDFKLLIRDLKTVGDYATFHFKENKLHVYSSEQQKEYRAILEEGSPLISVASTVDEAKASYSIDLLRLATRAASASKNITLSFDNDKPMKIVFELEGGGSITYWLTPRFE